MTMKDGLFGVCSCVSEELVFKQFLQAEALQILQVDSFRIGGVNELLSVILMAKNLEVRGVRFKCEVTIVRF